MSTENHIQQSPSQSNQQSPINWQGGDEIDLMELMCKLWQGKWLIIGITVLFAVVTFAYLQTTTRYYKTNIVMTQVMSGQIAAIDISSETAFANLQTALLRYDNLSEFYKNNPELFEGYELEQDTTENLTKFFNDNFKLNADDVVNFELTYPESVNGPELLNLYLSFVVQKLKEEIVIDIKENKKYAYERSSLDLAVLNNLNQEIFIQSDRMELFDVEAEINDGPKVNSDAVKVNEANQTLIDTGRAAVVGLLASTNLNLARAERPVAALDEFSIVDIVQPALTPLSQFKPRKAMILALAIILGGMLGCGVVILKHAVASYKK